MAQCAQSSACKGDFLGVQCLSCAVAPKVMCWCATAHPKESCSALQFLYLILLCMLISYHDDCVMCPETPTFFLQDPLVEGTQANTILLDIRKRKGLKPMPSALNEYEDKL